MSNYGRQFAFAFAPVPAYLPQYYSLCRSSNDPVLERKIPYAARRAFDHEERTVGMLHINNTAGTNSIGNTHGHCQTHKITESGFSSSSIMILLTSHVFRLQYFLGSAVVNTFSEHSADSVHFDLVTQSLVMIIIQVMLLSAVTRRRRMIKTKKIKSDDEYQNIPPSPRQSSISQTPFIWLVKPRSYWHWDTVHQYVELVIVTIILMYIFFRHYLYPNDFLEYINSVKIMSVLLESCLALPQMMLNYQTQSTEGLSLVMVSGWVVGDILKLVYFLIGSGVIKWNHEVSKVVSEKSDDEMTIFIFGCIFALIMDIIVGLQVTKYYPSSHMLALQARAAKLWVKFERRVLQIDYNSLPRSRQASMDTSDFSTC